MEELKKCPFCGGNATVFVSEGGVYVICTQCFVRTQTLIDSMSYKKPTNAIGRVIEQWNRRAKDD